MTGNISFLKLSGKGDKTAVYKPRAPVKYSPITGSGTRPPRLSGQYVIYNDRSERLYHGETNNL